MILSHVRSTDLESALKQIEARGYVSYEDLVFLMSYHPHKALKALERVKVHVSEVRTGYKIPSETFIEAMGD